MRRSNTRLTSLISLVSATALIACSGGDDPDTGTGGGRDATVTGMDATANPDAEVDAGVGMDAEPADTGDEPDAGQISCLVEEMVDTTPDTSCMGQWMATIGGVLQSDNGDPINDGRAQVCIRTPDGVLTCLRPKESCSQGEWEVLVPDNVRCVSSLVMHSFAFDRPFADTYCPLDVAGLDVRATLPDPVVLYEVTPPANLPPLGDGSQMRTITLGDMEVDVTPDQLFEGYENIAAAKVPGTVSPRPCFYAATDDFDAMYGFTPSINIDGATGFPFRIGNTGLMQGTMVVLYVLGSLDCQLDETFESIVEEGHWEKYSTVTVGANGEIAGNLPCFNWFAYKAQ